MKKYQVSVFREYQREVTQQEVEYFGYSDPVDYILYLAETSLEMFEEEPFDAELVVILEEYEDDE